MRLVIDLANLTDCRNGLEVVKSFYPELFGGKAEDRCMDTLNPGKYAEPVAKSRPAEPVAKSRPALPDENVPPPHTDADEPPVQQAPVKTTPKAEPEVVLPPEEKGATREDIQALAKSYLKQFGADPTQLKSSRTELIDLLLQQFSAPSTQALKDKDLDAAYAAVEAWIKEKNNG